MNKVTNTVMTKLLACATACLLLLGAQTATADRVSVSLNFNSVPDWRYRDYQRATSGLGIAYTTTWGAPYNTWNRRGGNTVIVHQNTYVNNEPRVVHRSTRNTSSLLRDVNGRCFERNVDSRGNETRIELPASNCNF